MQKTESPIRSWRARKPNPNWQSRLPQQCVSSCLSPKKLIFGIGLMQTCNVSFHTPNFSHLKISASEQPKIAGVQITLQSNLKLTFPNDPVTCQAGPAGLATFSWLCTRSNPRLGPTTTPPQRLKSPKRAQLPSTDTKTAWEKPKSSFPCNSSIAKLFLSSFIHTTSTATLKCSINATQQPRRYPKISGCLHKPTWAQQKIHVNITNSLKTRNSMKQQQSSTFFVP